MNADGSAHCDSCSHREFVQFPTATCDVDDAFAKAILPGPALSFNTIVPPGLSSVIVPLPSVVVVVVVVSVNCAHANGRRDC